MVTVGRSSAVDKNCIAHRETVVQPATAATGDRIGRGIRVDQGQGRVARSGRRFGANRYSDGRVGDVAFGRYEITVGKEEYLLGYLDEGVGVVVLSGATQRNYIALGEAVFDPAAGVPANRFGVAARCVEDVELGMPIHETDANRLHLYVAGSLLDSRQAGGNRQHQDATVSGDFADAVATIVVRRSRDIDALPCRIAIRRPATRRARNRVAGAVTARDIVREGDRETALEGDFRIG